MQSFNPLHYSESLQYNIMHEKQENNNTLGQVKVQQSEQQVKKEEVSDKKQIKQEFFVIHKPKNKEQGQPRPFIKQRLSQMRKSVIKPDQILRMRIPSDQIIVKDEDSLSLSQSITCPICLMILQCPYYECQGCSNGFCTLCLESWWKKSPNSCAYKCENVQFKQVKRSNTYNAVLGMLKVKCQYCRQQFTIADISNHILKSCPEVPQFCRFCDQKLTRKTVQDHQNSQCPRRPLKCQYCEIEYQYCDQKVHGDLCLEKTFKCQNEQCNQNVKRRNLESHSKSCDFKIVSCQWCEQQMKQKQYKKHEQTCQKKMVECVWCRKKLSIKESVEHQQSCEFKKDTCRLCHEMVLTTEIQKHRIECMFENLIEMKNKNEALEAENIRLKEKIMMLEGIIEESIADNKSSAIKAVSEMREQDKKIIEKDLLRLDNSIKSVQKLKKQEFAAHMKFPHLIQSWCPICRELEKKFKGMLDPLVEQRKEVLTRIAEIQRYSYTPK